MDRHGRSVATARAGESVVLALAPVAGGDLETVRYVPRVTPCHARVTPCHAVSRRITPCHAASRPLSPPCGWARLHGGVGVRTRGRRPLSRCRCRRFGRGPRESLACHTGSQQSRTVTAVMAVTGSQDSFGGLSRQSRAARIVARRRALTRAMQCLLHSTAARAAPCRSCPWAAARHPNTAPSSPRPLPLPGVGGGGPRGTCGRLGGLRDASVAMSWSFDPPRQFVTAANGCNGRLDWLVSG